jgi:hypothetical protein
LEFLFLIADKGLHPVAEVFLIFFGYGFFHRKGVAAVWTFDVSGH